MAGFSVAAREREEALVLRAKNGDQSAFGELYAIYHRRVFGVCLKITGNYADAEEASQDAFMNAYEHVASFHGNSAFGTWLHRIAVNEALMLVRRRPSKEDCTVSIDIPIERDDGERTHYDLPAAGIPQLEIFHRESYEHLMRLILGLPADYRTVFFLRYVEELTIAECEEALNLKSSTIKSTARRARLKLAQTLSRESRVSA